MSRRKLTRQQLWRAEKVQEERIKRAQRRDARLGESLDIHDAEERQGTLVSNFGATLEVEGEDGSRVRCSARQNIGTPVVGDRVVWQAHGEGGVVTALQPRRTLLAKPDKSGQLKGLAANLDQIIVVVAPAPLYSLDLIDNYLVAAESTGITPLILLNKIDLLDDDARAEVDRELAIYPQLGYTLIRASTHTAHGLDALHEALKGRSSVFAGQSGVGKSSLVNHFIPHEEALVGAISEQSGLGRHTTSASRLYHLPDGGSIIDSPGVREFRIWPMPDEQLVEGYREFREHLGHCRFRDCSHVHEPGCALLGAIKNGDIDPRRHASFLRLRQEMATQQTRHSELESPYG